MEENRENREENRENRGENRENREENRENREENRERSRSSSPEREELHGPVFMVDEDFLRYGGTIQIPEHLLRQVPAPQPQDIDALQGGAEGSSQMVEMVYPGQRPRMRIPGHINHSIQRTTSPATYERVRSLFQNLTSSSDDDDVDFEDADVGEGEDATRRNERRMERRMREIIRIVNDQDFSTTDTSSEENN